MNTRQTDPGVEFEGPMGYFWPIQEVPDTALIAGIAEIVRELAKRANNHRDKDKEVLVDGAIAAWMRAQRETDHLPLTIPSPLRDREERKRDG